MNLMRKRRTLVVLTIAIALFSVAVFTELNGGTGLSVLPDAASSTASTSSAQVKTTFTSISSRGISTFIGFNQAYLSLFATPSATMNYTLTISQSEMMASHVILFASSKVAGVTLTVNPKEFTFYGTQEDVALGISVAPTVNSSIIPVEVIASSVNGKTNSSFDFILDKALVVILPIGHLAPPTLHVGVGQKVTWLNLIDQSDPAVANVFFADGSAASLTMGLNDVWSHTFGRPGTYPYQVTLTGYPTASGVVIVA